MTMPSIRDTTVEHLGPNADQLDLDAYQLAARILSVNHQNAEQWAVDQVWNNGDWVPVALVTIREYYPSLAVRDQCLADAFAARYAQTFSIRTSTHDRYAIRDERGRYVAQGIRARRRDGRRTRGLLVNQGRDTMEVQIA